MNNSKKEPPKSSVKPPRKQPLRLPFDNRKRDFIEWAYDNRIGLIVTIVAYIILSAAFIVSKVVTSEVSMTNVVYIDMNDIELLEEEKERLLKEEQSSSRWGDIRNVTSNENLSDKSLADDRNTNVDELMDRAKRIQDDISNNQSDYNKALSGIALIGQDDKSGPTEDEEKVGKRHDGPVTVSFSLSNPTRYEKRLVKPAYRCKGGGEVVVAIAVNQRGEVISAKVVKSSGADAYMREVAEQSARDSRFDVNRSAPAKQEGTITYIFIPQ